MPLTPEQIAALYAKKANKSQKPAPGDGKTAQGVRRKLGRIHTHYGKLPKNHLVYPANSDGRSMPCESSGCHCPSHHRLRGQVLCNLHLIFALVHEINLLSHNGAIKTTGVPTATGGVAAPVNEGRIPVVMSNIITGSESDGDSYL